MRARMAINYACQSVELREVVLRDKPNEMLAASAKGTVPVLVLPSSTALGTPSQTALSEDATCQDEVSQGSLAENPTYEATVLDESLDIMQWALEQNDPEGWLSVCDGSLNQSDLVARNDLDFKPMLDRYKYFDRHPEASQDDYLEKAKPFLLELDQLIAKNKGFLSSDKFSATDAAILPFIRQFAHVDLSRFHAQGLSDLSGWLSAGLASPTFTQVMSKYPAWSSKQNNSVTFGV